MPSSIQVISRLNFLRSPALLLKTSRAILAKQLLAIGSGAAMLAVSGGLALAATAADPTKSGPFKAKSGTYKFAATVDNLVTQFAKTEIWAKVWYPTGKSFNKAPIAVLLHGNHGTCGQKVKASDGKTYRIDDNTDYSTTGTCPSGYVVTPNHLGYDYVAKTLATNGFVVVSINANRGITAHPETSQENDPGLIQRRGRMILRHLQILGQWNKNGGQPGSVGFNFKGKLDFSRVVLFGHSRGGDGIVAAYNLLKTSSQWRSRLPNGTKIVGLASMAPTDFQNGSPNVRGTALAVLLPLCDGDVQRLSGIGFYDRTIAGGKDTAKKFKAVMSVWSTNHNGYNTEWQTDDNYTADDHVCTNGRLFKFQIGLSPQQQKIGRYYLMALARGTTQNMKYAQLFNPAYDLPSPLKSLTAIDRSFFLGTKSKATRMVRFDGTCSQKLLVTSGVNGTCFQPAEHDPATFVGRVRWNDDTGQSNRFALLVVNGGGGTDFSGYKTLDMRVGPDCFLLINSNPEFKGCTNFSPTGGNSGSQNVTIFLRDTGDNLSKGVKLDKYTPRRPAVGLSIPTNGGAGSALPVDPLFHAILASARIPTSAFAKSGFNMQKVKYIQVNLGGASAKGGLYFGDVTALGANPPAVKKLDAAAVAEAAELGKPASEEASIQLADFTPAQPLPPLTGGTTGATSDGSAIEQGVRGTAGSAKADPGNRILSVTRGRLTAAVTGSAQDKSPMATKPVVEFLLATREPIAETSDSGLAVVIGGRRIAARYFETGREAETPSVVRLVVPAEAIDAASDGASLAVTSPFRTWQFGPLEKKSIR